MNMIICPSVAYSAISYTVTKDKEISYEKDKNYLHHRSCQ